MIIPCTSPLARAGQTQFCVNVTDGGSSTTACVTIVTEPPPVPTTPDAVDDEYTCPLYTACTVGASAGLLLNDTTNRTGPITVTGYANLSDGTIVVHPNGSFEWTPPYP